MKHQNIVIITSLGEPHGACFRAALELTGKEAHIWYPNMLGLGSSASAYLYNSQNEIKLEGLDTRVTVTENDTVLFKRFDMPNFTTVLEKTDAMNCATASYNFIEGLFEAITIKCNRPVNPYFNSVKAKKKVFQHLIAQQCGLLTLETITSNNSDDLLNVPLSKEPAVMKGLNTANWQSDKKDHTKALTTTRIDIGKADLSGVQFFPAIYQSFIRASYEVRAIVFGRKIVSAKILRNQSEGGPENVQARWNSEYDFDWRVWPKDLVVIEPYSLPESIECKIFHLMEKLGLEFGAVDFVVDDIGNLYFLEINASGNFLFLEESCDELPLLDTMCQFLCHDVSDGPFIGINKKMNIKLSDVKPIADKFTAFERLKYNTYKQNLTK